MAIYGGMDKTEALTQAFVRSMEMEREERGGEGIRQYIKETSDIEAELGRVTEVGKTAVQKKAEIETEAKGTAEKKLLDWTIILASVALAASGGFGGPALQALLKGSKTARYGATLLGSLFAGGQAQKAGREVTLE